ncbi:MAG: hypothetical protein EBR87_07700, partial [Cytophagia bacterium]|nr:hypothetical protein [Cytophagia bacterium]
RLPHMTAKSIVLILTSTFVFFSCNSSEENGKNGASNTSESDQIALNAWEKSGDLVQKITLSSKGVIRNKEWGISIDSLQEKLELAENQPANGKSYTLYFDDSDLNFTDISYLSDSQQKLTEIDFDIFVETKSQVEELKEKFTSYLQVKFGASKSEGNKIIWEKDKNTQVILQDVSTDKDPGIKLVFSRKN